MKKYNFRYVKFDPFPRNSPTPNYNPNYLGAWRWGADEVGFGQVAMFKLPDGRLWFDAEMMSKDFIKQMLCYAVDTGLLDHETQEVPEFLGQDPTTPDGGLPD